MKARQQLAHSQPCYVATDCYQPRFFSDKLVEGRQLRLGLTVNVGLE